MLLFLPFISGLIEFNYALTVPSWLAEAEIYFKASEEKARQLTDLLLCFSGLEDLVISIVIMAIIPGILEEFFFRGMIQTQLQEIFKNKHYAIFLAAFLFSLFHFQFYALIPKMISGVLFGYLFLWSKNIWYSCAAHVTNNLIGVVAAYFLGPEIMHPEQGGALPTVLLVSSAVITLVVVLYLRKILIVSARPDG